MTPPRRRDPWQRLVFGLAVLTAGVVFWLDRVGTIDAGDYLRWWPLALIAMGLAHIIERRWLGAAIWMVIGAYFLLPLVGLERIHLWRIIGMWPLLISVGGITLVLQALRRAKHPPAFTAVAVMAGNNRRVGSRPFLGGEVVAVMGGCEIDLTAAQIETEAVIDVLAFWGGIEIRVPAGWRVVRSVATILGGYEDKTSGAVADDAPRLVIRGSAIMGGVEVRTVAEAAAA